jgi:hypothetical protein
MMIGAKCAVPECGRYVLGHGTQIAKPMRWHEAYHKPEDYPQDEDGGSILWHFDPIILGEHQ